MRKLSKLFVIALMGLSLLSVNASAQDANEIMKKSHMNYYYAGEDGKSEVVMRLIDDKGNERIRKFTMLRLDKEDGGDQMYYTYFFEPSDVARMTFMVHKNAEGNDMRWIFVPALNLVRPISADDKNSSFVGSDFSYEDVSGRHFSEDNHTFVEESTLDGKAVYVIESTPKDEGYDGFARKVSYIDKETYLPLKEEYYNDKGELERVFLAEKIETVGGIPTVTTRSMENVKKDQKTIVEFSSIEYGIGVDESIFTERYLQNPPRQYIR